VQQKKVEEHVVMLGDYEAQNKRTASENAMLFTKYALSEFFGLPIWCFFNWQGWEANPGTLHTYVCTFSPLYR
jgi:hypothetical protein